MNDVPAPIVTQWTDERGDTIIHTVTFRKARDSDLTSGRLVYDQFSKRFTDTGKEPEYED